MLESIILTLTPRGTRSPTEFLSVLNRIAGIANMERLEQINSWLAGLWPGRRYGLAPASADASFRRYFRATLDDGTTRIVMDAPPANEDCRPWLHVQQLFQAAGAHVPEVLAQDLERGFLLLSDLGDRTYLQALDADNATPLYADAIAALVKIQQASRPGALPDYDAVLLRRELLPSTAS